MGRLAQTDGLTDVQEEIIKAVRVFVDEQIIPVAQDLEHKDEYPQEIVDGLKELGVFGLTIPEEFGGLGESLLTYALVVEEIARGWMSVSGVINTHFIVAYLLMQHGTEEQKAEVPPADGDRRGPRRVLDVRARAGLRRLRRVDQGHEAGRRVVLHHRPEDVADQRRLVHPGRAARQDRRGRRQRLQEHDHLPRREGGRLRGDRPGRHRAGQDRQDGLQGRRDDRAASSRATRSVPTRSSAASRARASSR